jgi:hypothetical protein
MTRIDAPVAVHEAGGHALRCRAAPRARGSRAGQCERPPRLRVRQRTGHAHQDARARRLRRVVRREAVERQSLRVAARDRRVQADRANAGAVRRAGGGPALAAPARDECDRAPVEAGPAQSLARQTAR